MSSLSIQLPDYSKGEEIFNMTTHIVGGVFGVFALVACVVTGAVHGNPWGVIGGAIYGACLVWLYVMSSVYHGLPKSDGKKIMRVMDHCTIYYLIAGTYTPILFCAIMPCNAVVAWVIFGIEWGLAVIATVFTAIDLKKFSVVSMICYIGMGWCILCAMDVAISALTSRGFIVLLLGGIAYTVGAILYGLGRKHKYFHSVFHLFVLLGSVLQFVSIIVYVL